MTLQYATARNVSIADTSFLQIPPLKRFYEKAPSWSRIALEKGKGLTDPLSKDNALRDGKLIQFNSAKLICYLAFDVDEMHPDEPVLDDFKHNCFYNWFYAGLPPPQIIIRNKLNGHCQYFYELKFPVSISHLSAPKPQYYLHAIRKQMTLALNADSAYTHALSKNPFNNANQEVFYSLIEPYELADLDNLDRSLLNDFKPSNPNDYLGLGRNNDIFHTVRFDVYAYKANCDRYEQLYNFCLNECRALNEEISKSYDKDKLNDNEIRSTAKSIARWTWQRYNGKGKHNDKYFSLEQAKRGKKGGKATAKKTNNKNKKKKAKAKKLYLSGMTKIAIAEKLNIHRNTISDWLKDVKR